MNAALAIPSTHEVRGGRAAGAEAGLADTLTVRVTGAESIDADFIAAWSALVGAASEPNSFAEPWFVAAGLQHLTDDRDLKLVTVWDGDAMIGLVPLVVLPRYGRVPGAHVQNWKHANDFLGAPLVRRGYEQRFWEQVLATLDQAEWAPGFLHVNALVEGGAVLQGLSRAAAAGGRRCDIVHRLVRAQLASRLSPEAYYADTVRKKKRKELGRLQRRLGELGAVTARTLDAVGELAEWCAAFLALEHRGWKGRAGSSLASDPKTAAFFRDSMAGAFAAGRLEFRRMDLDGKPIAMLINFIAPPGSFSFKTAFDEDYARYSPGVLIQLDNLAVIERADIHWMDSCAAQDHPMIDSLWGERRSIVRVSVALSGIRRGLAFKTARMLEEGSVRWRALRKKEKPDG